MKFIEVGLPGWDTHFENNNAIRQLCGIADPAMSTLVDDLKARGLFDSTLVVWMGEFGRTPQFKRIGRDHYARAWSTALMGGGVRGGVVVGRTDRIGGIVTERPISVPDFMATVCQILGIDWRKTYDATGGRPVPMVATGANVVREIVA